MTLNALLEKVDRRAYQWIAPEIILGVLDDLPASEFDRVCEVIVIGLLHNFSILEPHLRLASIDILAAAVDAPLIVFFLRIPVVKGET